MSQQTRAGPQPEPENDRPKAHDYLLNPEATLPPGATGSDVGVATSAAPPPSMTSGEMLLPRPTAMATSTRTVRSPKRVVEPALRAPHASRRQAKGTGVGATATAASSSSPIAYGLTTSQSTTATATTAGGSSSDAGPESNSDNGCQLEHILLEDIMVQSNGGVEGDRDSPLGVSPSAAEGHLEVSANHTKIAYISTLARPANAAEALLEPPAEDSGISTTASLPSTQRAATHAEASTSQVLYKSTSSVGMIEEQTPSSGASTTYSSLRATSTTPIANTPASQGKRVYGSVAQASEVAMEYNTVYSTIAPPGTNPTRIPGYDPAIHSYSHPVYNDASAPLTVPTPSGWSASGADTSVIIPGVPPPLPHNLDDSDDDDDTIYGLGPAAGSVTPSRGRCCGRRGKCGNCCLIRRLRKCECDRVRSHCYFICCFVLYLTVSSLARFLVFADALVHVILYSLTVAEGGFFQYLDKDLKSFTYDDSVADMLLLSLARSLVLFFAYAYRFHLSSPAILTSWVLMAFSVAYAVAKFITAYSLKFAPFLFFSLAISIFEWLIYVVVRRRRVTAPTVTIPVIPDQTPAIDKSQSLAASSMLPPAPELTGVQTVQSLQGDRERLNSTVNGSVGTKPTSSAPDQPKAFAHPGHAAEEVALASGRRASLSSSSATGPFASILSAASLTASSPLSTSLLRNETDPLAPYQIADSNSLFTTIDGVDIHYRLVVHDDIRAAQEVQLASADQVHDSESKSGDSQHQDILAKAHAAASKPVLVLFHGLGGSSHSWDAVIPALAPFCSAILAFDRPGAGLSARPTRLPNSLTVGGKQVTHSSVSADGKQTSNHVVLSPLPTYSMRFAHASHELNLVSTLDIPVYQGSIVTTQRVDPQSLSPYFEAADTLNFKLATTSQLVTVGPTALVSGGEDIARLAASSTWQRTQELAEAEAEAVMRAGAGENPYRSDFSLRAMFAILRQHGITPSNCRNIVLLAHHSGAAHAIRCALACPRSISALIFVAPNVFDDGIPSAVRSALRTRLGRGLVQQMLKTEIAAVVLKRAWLDSAKVPPAVIQYLRLQARLPGWQEAFVEMVGLPAETAPQSVLEAIESSKTGAQNNVGPVMTAAAAAALAARNDASKLQSTGSNAEGLGGFLGLLKCPVLILHGDQDRVVPFSASQKLAKALTSSPSVSVATITNCGNVPHEESPIAFSEIVTDFLSQLTDGRRRRFRMLASAALVGAQGTSQSQSPGSLILPSQLPAVAVNAIAAAASAENVSLPHLPASTVTCLSPSGVPITVPTDDEDPRRRGPKSPSGGAGGINATDRQSLPVNTTSPLLSRGKTRSEGSDL